MIKRTRRSFTALVLILSILASLMVLTIPNVFADDARSLAVSAATRNLFYSDYASAGYYRNTAVQDTDPITGDYYYWYKDDGLQRRSNCYGYSFRFFIHPKTSRTILRFLIIILPTSSCRVNLPARNTGWIFMTLMTQIALQPLFFPWQI